MKDERIGKDMMVVTQEKHNNEDTSSKKESCHGNGQATRRIQHQTVNAWPG